MNTKLVRVLPAAAVLAAVVAVSASTGAVAGALITGADIKNGSVASADIKNKSITGKDVKNRALTAADLSAATIAKLKGGSGPAGPIGPSGISGLERVENTKNISAGTGGNVVVACPAGTKVLGIAADWTASVEGTSTWISSSLDSGIAYGMNNTGSTKTLRATATCAVVG
ncbi:hypothetical protein [Nocardioides sp. 1609]|uniref:hypothetical protein n=1 Tax=Nocardioides sp. 1609 TaxID=2508327 RepID=UPI00106FE8D8|nr:hypothetical protein [Nocardioides sp. 1609]